MFTTVPSAKPDSHSRVCATDNKPETSPREGLLWIRQGFMDVPDASGRIVVHGHTPSGDGRIVVAPGLIGIDTGAVFGQPLSALRLPEGEIWQATRMGSVAHARL